jgi:hypothetical protein
MQLHDGHKKCFYDYMCSPEFLVLFSTEQVQVIQLYFSDCSLVLRVERDTIVQGFKMPIIRSSLKPVIKADYSASLLIASSKATLKSEKNENLGIFNSLPNCYLTQFLLVSFKR